MAQVLAWMGAFEEAQAQIDIGREKAEDANVADYTLDELGAGFTFGIPVSEFNFVTLGVTGENTEFKPGNNASREVLRFRNQNGSEFNTVTVSASWANDTRNSRLLPDRGSLTKFSAEVAIPGLDLSFYKLRNQAFNIKT